MYGLTLYSANKTKNFNKHKRLNKRTVFHHFINLAKNLSGLRELTYYFWITYVI